MNSERNARTAATRRVGERVTVGGRDVTRTRHTSHHCVRSTVTLTIALVCAVAVRHATGHQEQPEKARRPFFSVQVFFKSDGKFTAIEPLGVSRLLESELRDAGIDSAEAMIESMSASVLGKKARTSAVRGEVIVSRTDHRFWAAQAFVRRTSSGELLWAGTRYTAIRGIRRPANNDETPNMRQSRRDAEADDSKALHTMANSAVKDLVNALKYGKFPEAQ